MGKQHGKGSALPLSEPVASLRHGVLEWRSSRTSDSQRHVALADYMTATPNQSGRIDSGAGAGVCQRSCPPISCGVSDFRGADFAFGVEPDGSSWLPVAGFA